MAPENGLNSRDGADLDGDLLLAAELHQKRVFSKGEAVSDPFRSLMNNKQGQLE